MKSLVQSLRVQLGDKDESIDELQQQKEALNRRIFAEKQQVINKQSSDRKSDRKKGSEDKDYTDALEKKVADLEEIKNK